MLSNSGNVNYWISSSFSRSDLIILLFLFYENYDITLFSSYIFSTISCIIIADYFIELSLSVSLIFLLMKTGIENGDKLSMFVGDYSDIF